MAAEAFRTELFEFRVLSDTQQSPVILYISNVSFREATEELYDEIKRRTTTPFTFCELQVFDWDKYLTPWKADAAMNGREFAGNALELLREIEKKVVPRLREYIADTEIYLAGYSLAGLFALWAMYESDLFEKAACCSGSVWYPGWKEYALQHTLKKPGSVYLSLGKKEKKAGNSYMKTVEEHMKLQSELLQQDKNVMQTHLEWHEGGHFHQTKERMAMGICWMLDGR